MHLSFHHSSEGVPFLFFVSIAGCCVCIHTYILHTYIHTCIHEDMHIYIHIRRNFVAAAYEYWRGATHSRCLPEKRGGHKILTKSDVQTLRVFDLGCRVCIHTYIHTYYIRTTYVHAYIKSCIHTYLIHTCIHSDMHTYIHTYSQKLRRCGIRILEGRHGFALPSRETRPAQDPNERRCADVACL